MSDNFIAPIQVADLFVVESNFRIEQAPAANMDLRIDVDYHVVQLAREGGNGSASLELRACACLVDKDGDRDEKMHADATVHIAVSSSLPDDVTDEAAREYLLTNAISMAYSHAKSYLMVVTGLSPMGSLTIPAILPSELAKGDDTPLKNG